ncbi:MAG: methyltransferase domain-containing protein [Gemmatimonadetes bacterium]|nr:methyltransferase domain-containing protein [Gemmatimonadota bacterium]
MGSPRIDTRSKLSPIMDVRDAARLLAPVRPRLHSPGPWVDLGCGAGTFTGALAEQLPSHSTIEAVDRDTDALRRVPPLHAGIVIRTTQFDFDARPLPWSGLAGVLMANALHFVAGQEALLERLAASLRPSGHLVVVEYDSETPKGEWVPHPVSARSLARLASATGFTPPVPLGRRRSSYGGVMYAALLARSTTR